MRHCGSRVWTTCAAAVIFPLLGGVLSRCLAEDASRILVDCPEFRLVLLYPTEKILKDDPLPGQGQPVAAEGVTISAAKGELESFLLILRPRQRRPLMDVRFETPALQVAAGNAKTAASIEYQRVGYVHIDAPSGTSVFPDTRDRYTDGAIPFGGSGRVGYFPERLVPERLTVAPPGENTQFWFTVGIPLDADAGTVKGTMTLRLRGGEPVAIPLTVTIYDFSLPSRPSPRNTCCWSPQYLDCRQDKDFLRTLYRDMVRCRQAPDPILPQPGISIEKDGSVTIDLDDYDEMATYCLDALGATHLFFPRVGGAWYTNVYFLWHNPLLKKERWYGVQIFDDELNVTAEFRQTFGDYLRQMTDYFRRKNWLGRVYMTTMDEPHSKDDLRAVRNYAAFVQSVAPEIRMFCTTYPREGVLGSIDAWCPQQFDEDLVAERRKLGEELMFYKNWLHLIDMPMVNPRLQGWLAWRMGAVGWLTYATMGRWRRAWDEPYVLYPNTGIKAWGLGLWWYPDFLEKKILRSVRWELMREGAEDYEYLALLQQRLRSLPDPARTSPGALAAESFLRSAPRDVALYPRVLPASLEDGWSKRPCFTTSHQAVWELRNKAAELIETLAAPSTGP